MSRMGISREHARQLQQQSVAHRRRMTANGVAAKPLPKAPPSTPQPTPEAMPQPPAQPAARPKPTKEQLRRIKHARKQGALMKSLAGRPWDVRCVVWIEEFLTQCVILITHFYVDARSFLAAHSAGTCSVADRELRLEKCSTCESAYVDCKGHGYCRGCNCGEWPPSRRTHQIRLAKFACPEKKFGRAPGWIPRLRQRLRLGRRSKDRS